MKPRPDDELDLTKLEKPLALLHRDTIAYLKTWPYGWQLLSGDGNWVPFQHYWLAGTVYRARPAPALNLIEREGMVPACGCGRDMALWETLAAADRLIRNPENAQLRAEYWRAIK